MFFELLPDAGSLVAFLAASLLLLVVPGPAVLYVVARSLDQGRRAGLVSVLAVAFGAQLQIAAAAAGLSAVVLQSAAVYSTVKFFGAAYLIYLGVSRLRESDQPLDVAKVDRRCMRGAFFDGVVVSFLNPKSALFFVAFLPQFTDPARGPLALQFMALGAVFLVVAVASDSVYACLAGGLADWMRGSATSRRRQRLATGSLYIGLGLAAGLSGEPNSNK